MIDNAQNGTNILEKDTIFCQKRFVISYDNLNKHDFLLEEVLDVPE
jgi:hypothetical protein